MDSVGKLTDWLEEDLPGRFAEMLDVVLGRLPNKNKNRRTTTMTDAVDTTQWSLPGPADMPRDELQIQLEVYKETILLRGFENDSTWVRTVSADAIANVFTQHLGSSSGLLPRRGPLVEPGRDRTGGGPLAAAAGLVRGPATGGVQAPRPAPAARCRGWSSSARRAARPGSTPR